MKTEMKNIFRLLAGCTFFIAYSCQAQLVLTPGSVLKSDSSCYVVMNDLGIQHHSSSGRFDNVFKFMGSANVKKTVANKLGLVKSFLRWNQVPG